MRLSERGSDASDDAATGLPQPPPPPPPPLTTPGGRGGSGSDNGAPISPHYDAGAADGSRATSPKLQGSDSKATSVDPSTRSEADASEVSSGSGSGGGAPISPHYDAARDVVLRLEFLRPAEVKAIIRGVRVAVVAGLVLLAVFLWMKIDKPHDYYLQSDSLLVTNLCIGCVLCAAMLACWALFFFRVYRSNLSHKRWSHRRKRAAVLAGSEMTMQLVNVVFFILPNAYVLTHACSWFHPVVLWSGFVRWTIWNSLLLLWWVQANGVNLPYSPYWRKWVGRSDAAIMDAPLRAHWRKLGLWLLLEGILLALTVVVKADPAEFVWDPSIPDCHDQAWNCQFSAAALALLGCNTAAVVTYFLCWLSCIARSFLTLRRLPYNQMRMANIITRLQVRLRGLSVSFFVLCIICFTWVHIGSCSSFVISWLGYTPMQVVASVTAIANAYMCMPKRPHEMGILTSWLQEFAWTEAEVARKREERSSSLPQDSFENFCLDCEPLFTFETCVKLLYWSFLVYDHGEHDRTSPYVPEVALRLYDLENFEVFWEKSLDTKAVVGWNSDTVVIAFRGTASLKNAREDLQVWRTRFPEGIGSPVLCSAPLVHSGFLRCYKTNGFSERVLSRLEHILYKCTAEQGREEEGQERPVQVYVTGHSLGGALAMLCAYDIKKRCPCAEYLINVKCYTFGAPRVGNAAWAKEYNAAVPDTWHLVNSDDAVTQAGKFVFLFSRTGHRVLVNKLGDMLVRPNYLETALRGVPGGGSVKDHFLTSYQKAISAVVAAQFSNKSFAGGKDGVLSLTSQKGVSDVLESAGLHRGAIEVLQSRGWDAYQRLLRQKMRGSRRSRRSRGGSKDAAQLEAVVVEAPPKEEEEKEGEQHAAAAAVVAAAALQEQQGAAAAGAEGGAPGAVPRQTSEERDGVLHTAVEQMRCRGSSRRCHTICQLLQRQPAAPAAAPAAAAAEPLGDPAAPGPGVSPPPSPPPSPRGEAPLQAIAEDGELGAPPALTLPQRQAQPRQGLLGRLAALVGWEEVAPSSPRPLDHSLSGISLSSTTSSEAASSPGGGGMGTRGSMREAPAFPLVLDPAASGSPRRGAAT